ncbi:acetyl-CoA carboxylase biotin carboxyl carrier protein [Candidatus Aerophobetes bacterium]|uniref:Biotin carboxyl carrier protein of acetyl-CoA carboxylase n=1 Tax=Aerophobetes bacterium TaxID=2030807 RepID=A0A662DKW6_UNCAE|nr:MAG: acetyl-CoA carboxylase biotin carboxyl carrier protein [Candidatus Aerophobetes bacterium]
MDLEELKKIITIFESSSLSELEIEEKGVRFRLVKKGAASKVSPPELAPEERTEKAVAKPEVEPEKEEVLVKSPLVGTFYRARSPGEDPFVEVGQYIRPGQTLCIIEAMKVMNEVTSEVAGKVKKILVENGHPVEYDQELFVIEREG